MNHHRFTVVPSGSGFEIIDLGRWVATWTMTPTWATLVAQGLDRMVSELAGDADSSESREIAPEQTAPTAIEPERVYRIESRTAIGRSPAHWQSGSVQDQTAKTDIWSTTS